MGTPGELPATLHVVDSHTEGEPTRVVIEGWPIPDGSTMLERRAFMRAHQDHLRSAVVLEPRGHDAVVGALLVPPVTPGAEAGVVFFNNVGYLGMCGHGLIGVVRTLQSLGRVREGEVRIDTPAGLVVARLDERDEVTFENVPCYAWARDVVVDAPELGSIVGDVAYGGNWFFLTALPEVPITLANLDRLFAWTLALRRAIDRAGIHGLDGAEIDHVEITGVSPRADVDCRSFVLCPGGAYDRSPCGTGTSAKMAALHARGRLAPGRPWRQESITGGVFTGWLETRGEALVPFIRGSAFVTSHATLHFDPRDPLRGGFGPA